MESVRKNFRQINFLLGFVEVIRYERCYLVQYIKFDLGAII